MTGRNLIWGILAMLVAGGGAVVALRLTTGRYPWPQRQGDSPPVAAAPATLQPQASPSPTPAPEPPYRRPSGAPSLGDDLIREFDQWLTPVLGHAELAMIRLRRQIDASPQYYRVLAALALDRDRTARAAELLGRAYELDRDSVPTLIQLALVEVRRKNPAAAQAWLEKAAQIDEWNPTVLYNLAVAHQRQTRMHAAERCYRKLLATQPDHFEAQFNLAGIATYFGRGEPEWDKAVRMRPDHLDARYQLGLSRYLLGQHDKAIEQFEFVRVKRPADADAWYHLALAYQGRGDMDRAFAHYTEAVKRSPNDTLYLNGLADFHLTMHQRDPRETEHIDKAVRLWERSQAIDPKQESVRDRLSIFRPK